MNYLSKRSQFKIMLQNTSKRGDRNDSHFFGYRESFKKSQGFSIAKQVLYHDQYIAELMDSYDFK